MILVLFGSPAGASVSPKQFVTNAIAVTESVSSFTYIESAKKGNQSDTLHISAGVGSGVSQGTIGIGKGKATVRALAGTIYLNGNAAFWTTEGGRAAATAYANRWVSTSETSINGKSLVPLVDGATFFQQVFSSNLTSSVFTLAGTAKVNGKKATVVSIHNTKTKSTGRLYVARSGSPYVLRLVANSSKGDAVVTFSDYNRPVQPVAPSKAVDLDAASPPSG
jgi:hypothetical protein